MEGRSRRAPRGLRKSATQSRRTGQAHATSSRRTNRAAIRPPVSNRAYEAHSPAWAREHPQEAVRPQWCAESRTTHASGPRSRNTQRLAGPFPYRLVASGGRLEASDGDRRRTAISRRPVSLVPPTSTAHFIQSHQTGFHHGQLDLFFPFRPLLGMLKMGLTTKSTTRVSSC